MENKNYAYNPNLESVLKEINDLNLSAQNQYLVDNGFNKLKRNLKFLIKYDKDQEKALNALKEKMNSWGSGCKKKDENWIKQWQEKIDKNGFREQNAYLVSNGFDNLLRNFKKLKKFNGDQEKALNALNQKKACWGGGCKKKDENWIKQWQEKIDKNGFREQNAYLVSNGFDNLLRNFKKLKKFNGDQEKALNALNQKKACWGGGCKKKDENWIKQWQEKIDKNGFREQNAYLVSNGFDNLLRNFKKLKKFNGDQEKALNALNQKKACWGGGCKKKDENWIKQWQEKIDKNGLKEQNAYLVSNGFDNLRRNFKKLEKFEGDKEKALNALIKLKYKWELMKKAYNDEKQKILLNEINKLGYSSQNEILISKGFTNLKLNLKVLLKCKGVLEKSLNLVNKRCEIRELKKLFKVDESHKLNAKKVHDPELRKKLKEEIKSSLIREIDQSAKTIYLDGNNLLFLNPIIRKLCLQQKRIKAENAIEELAIEFSMTFGIHHLVLIFDKTNNPKTLEIGSLKFTVCSAIPNFYTSDDALVNLISGLSSHDDILIITSDLDLQIRLKEKGVKMIMKSGCWFKIMKEKLEKFNEIISKVEKGIEN